jgi:hypothetical protein
MKDAPCLSGFTACKPADPPTGGRADRFGAAVRGGPGIEVKDAPCLSGFTACKPADPPTGGRADRFGAAVRGGPWIEVKDAPCLSGFTACKPAEPPHWGAPPAAWQSQFRGGPYLPAPRPLDLSRVVPRAVEQLKRD